MNQHTSNQSPHRSQRDDDADYEVWQPTQGRVFRVAVWIVLILLITCILAMLVVSLLPL